MRDERCRRERPRLPVRNYRIATGTSVSAVETEAFEMDG
jgi:hypothetical protein